MLNDASQAAAAPPMHLVPTLGATSPRELRLQGVSARIPELRRITEQIFPGTVETEVAEDPEIGDYRMLVFNVEARGGFKQIHELRLEWYKQTAELLGNDVDLIVLSVHPIP
jgi:hypothetical protein